MQVMLLFYVHLKAAVMKLCAKKIPANTAEISSKRDKLI